MRPPNERSPAGQGEGFQRAQTNGRGLQENHTAADRLLPRLDKVRQTGPDQWIACCPAHGDKSPSLSIKQADDRLLVHCFAGCHVTEVVAAVGLTLADLFNAPLDHHRAALTQRQRARHDQARAALQALVHECRVVSCAAEQMIAGFALDEDENARLRLAVQRIETAERICQ